MRRIRLPRELLLVVAAVCVVVAVFLGLAAADVARWRSAVPGDDVRFRVGSGGSKLWRPETLASAIRQRSQCRRWPPSGATAERGGSSSSTVPEP